MYKNCCCFLYITCTILRRESAPRRSLRGSGGREAGWRQEGEETEGEVGEECVDRLNLAAADSFSSDVQLDDFSPTIHFIETFSGN